MSDYLGTAEIAQALGLQREYVTDRLVKRPDFPPPAIRLSRKTVRWERAKVEAWISQHVKRNSR